jgi:hypothetical protein
MEVFEKEDFERETGDVEPETVGVADEGWGVEVDCVEDVVLRAERGCAKGEGMRGERDELVCQL